MKVTPHFTILDCDHSDHPREKMLQFGASHLTNAELLAPLIGSGHPGETAVDLMKRLLQSFDHKLSKLHLCSIEQFMEWKGIGLAKAVKIKAALELAKRLPNETHTKVESCLSSKDAFRVLSPSLQFLAHEEFWVVFLNQRKQVLLKKCFSKGGIEATVVDIRLILGKALSVGATALIAAHNHTGGSLRPSQVDIQLTQRLFEAAKIMDIALVDHLILGQENYFSFADENML